MLLLCVIIIVIVVVVVIFRTRKDIQRKVPKAIAVAILMIDDEVVVSVAVAIAVAAILLLLSVQTFHSCDQIISSDFESFLQRIMRALFFPVAASLSEGDRQILLLLLLSLLSLLLLLSNDGIPRFGRRDGE